MEICAGMAGIVDYTNYDDMKYAVSCFLDGSTLDVFLEDLVHV